MVIRKTPGISLNIEEGRGQLPRFVLSAARRSGWGLCPSLIRLCTPTWLQAYGWLTLIKIAWPSCRKQTATPQASLRLEGVSFDHSQRITQFRTFRR